MSADPPVSADPRIVLSEYCTVYIQATSKTETGLVRFPNTCENHLSILIGKNRPEFLAIFFLLLTVVRCLSLCGCFPDSWPEKSIGHCIIFYHA